MKNRKKQMTKQVDEKEYLLGLLNQFTKLQICSKSKIEKYNELLVRKGAVHWSSEKKRQVESRLSQAQLEYMQSFEIIDQLKLKLSQM